ncbi:MAG: thioredoxin domain-containing protein [Dehalococcoidia bacterium]|nr:thioredoxin domain-containing protein [Dehalococcoidia bacterium]
MAERARFHFSPRPNRAAEIGWHDWGAPAFERARREDKPVLLGISAVWCHWCHVMDETSYSDPAIIALINERFVPVRVDNDQRPDVNARYNMGGWPTTAFLTPGGEVMAGMTYVPPDQMRDVLTQVSGYYRDNKAQIEEKIAEITANRERAEAATVDADEELTDQVFRDALHSTEDAYDPVYGGFGNEPKFPHTDAIDLLLRAYLRDGDRDALHMARKTLEQMCAGGTYDQQWGGFYRYSTKRDWSVPHYEKMLEDNAGLLRNLLTLYRTSDDAGHRRYIEFTIAYIDAWLSDATTGAFHGSQDADEEFYPLPAEERKLRPAPYVDRTVYTSWNAMMIVAYLDASSTLGKPHLQERALKALDFLWDTLHADDDGMYRYLGPQGREIAGLLGDQAWTAAALLDAYETAGRPQDFARAQALARWMVEHLSDEGDGFFDTPRGHGSLGRLASRQKPVKENAVAAEVFIRLGRLTHDPAYAEVARRTLLQFTEIIDAQGYFAAAYAVAVDRFLHTGADVKIVGDAAAPGTAVLRAAALTLQVADRSVRVIDPVDAAALAAEALPAQPSPAAYVCYGTLCSAPVTTPGDLIEAVARTRQAYEATRHGEPLAGPRGGGMSGD